MRLRCGSIPTNPGFDPEADGWRPIREPNLILLQFLALPIAVVVGALLFSAWYGLGVYELHVDQPLVLLAVLVGVIPLHEMIHGLVHPHFGLSSASVYGLSPLQLVFYAHYDDVLSRDRFLAILVAPFVAISLVPLVAAAIFGWTWPWLALLSVWNGILACGDLLGVLLLVTQIPRRAIVRNQGHRTYWKTLEQWQELCAADSPTRP